MMAVVLVAATVAAIQRPVGPDDDPVVLTIDGEEFTRTRYADWLFTARGEILAPIFARRWRLRRLAAAEGVAADPGAARERAAAELELRVAHAFGGDRERWVAELRAEGRSREGVVVERALEIEDELLLDEMARRRDVQPRALAGELDGPVELLPGARLSTGDDVPALGIDGAEVSREEYLAWLLSYRGELEARRLAETVRIERAAAAAGIELGAGEVAERLRSDVARIVEHEHRGDREAWVRSLAAAGRSVEQYERELSRRTELDLLVEKLVLRDRVVRPAEVRAEWERVHGKEGLTVEVRWIRLDAGSSEELERARALAADLRRRILEGEDFATLAERHSDDAVTRLRGGRPPEGFRVEHLPAPLVGPVRALARGEVSEPLEHEGSVYLFEATEVRVTPFDSVAEELARELRNRRPTEVEIAERKNLLVRGVDVRVLPAMFAE